MKFLKLSSRTRILVLEYVKEIRETLGEILRSVGYECQLASNAAEALECMANFDPALMIVDVNMPGVDGVELAKIVVRSRPLCAVLLHTGNINMEESLRAARGDGYNFRVLIKPAQRVELLTVIAQTLGN